MRISDAYLHRFVAQSTSIAKSQYYSASEDAVTLRRVSRPSDDLSDAQKILGIDRNLSRLDGMERARGQVRSDFVVVESALQQLNEEFIKLKELAIQMANDTLSAQERANGAVAAQAIRHSIFDLANTRQADGRYIFSGVAENNPSFAENGAYTGAFVDREVEIAPETFVGATFIVPDVFGGTNPLQTADLFMAALESNNLEGIQGTLDGVDELLAANTLALTDVGVRMNQVDTAAAISDELNFQFTVRRAELQDLDVAEAATEFQAAEQTLNAVIITSKRVMDMTIIPWLR